MLPVNQAIDMSCQQIPCTAESTFFLAQRRIATAKKAGKYSFGTFPAGNYAIQYIGGAMFDSVFQWNALSIDIQNLVCIACDGLLRIDFPNTGNGSPSSGFATQGQAEAANSNKTICFSHSGGDISIEYSSPIYSQQFDGSPNQTFNLLSVKTAIAADQFGKGSSGASLGVPRGGVGCPESVTCPDALAQNPISNYNSEAPDTPSNPGFPLIPSGPPNPFPPGGGGGSGGGGGFPPPLNNATYNCVIDSSGNAACTDPGDGSGVFGNLDDCNNGCADVPPIPPPPNPPPNHAASWNCDGHGTCSDPGDGSGQYSDYGSCFSACICTDFRVDSVSPSVTTFFPPPPFNASCTDSATFSGNCFIPGDILIVNGVNFSGLVISSDGKTATMPGGAMYGVCVDIGVGTFSCGIKHGILGPEAVLASGITFLACGNCGLGTHYNVCKPSYSGAQCNQSCDNCCNALNGLGVGEVSGGWSQIAIQACIGVDPAHCFYVGAKKFCPSFVATLPGGASYLTLDIYDITRVS